MHPYLQLDLNKITIDSQLAQKIPYALSVYYLALPLGTEKGRVSVAMAYPDNHKARHMLSQLLHAEVVPVFVPAESVQAALARIHHPTQTTAFSLIAWCDQPAWETAVTATAALLCPVHQRHIPHTLMPDQLGSATLTNSPPQLIVCPLPEESRLFAMLKEARGSLFFVRGAPQPIRKSLVVLRGFASDEHALAQLKPFLNETPNTVTLMPLNTTPAVNLNQYHHQGSPAGHHLHRCLQQLDATGTSINLKFRGGSATQQVVDELTEHSYDLLVLAAEADGDFVGRVITAVHQSHTHHEKPIFVLKPPYPSPAP